MFVVKNDSQIIVEIGLLLARNADDVRETFKNDALRFIEENGIEVKEFYLVGQEKDDFEIENLILRAGSPKEFTSNTIRTEIRSCLNEKSVDWASDKFIN